METFSIRILLLVALAAPFAWCALCPYGGWQYYRNSCYLFFRANYTRSWSDSRDVCMEQDGDLITIESTQERDWILGQCKRYTQLSQNHYRNWWIGLNSLSDASSHDEWKWPNQTTVNMTLFSGKWQPGQPKRDSTHQCVEIKDLKFNVERCSSAFQAICERPAGKPLTCDPGWTLHHGMCYRYWTSSQNYYGAKGICRRYGGNLPQIFDLDTQKEIWNMARDKGHDIWLSLSSIQQGSKYVFRWGNGSAVSSSAYWSRTLPASLGANVNKTCGFQTQLQNVAKSWNFAPCTSRKTFFCQKPEGSCPNGWLQLRNRCYSIFTGSARSFNSSLSYCTAMGANLAAFPNYDIVTFLYPYVFNTRNLPRVNSFWIGLTDNNNNTGSWKWVANNGNLGRWQNWFNKTSINTPNKQDCVFIVNNDRTLKWHPTAGCGSPRRFICELPVNKGLKQPSTPPPIRYTCERGYKLYSPLHTCIQLNTDDQTWDLARGACINKGAHLVLINDARFSNFITAQIRAKRGKYWIDLNDRGHENVYRWDSTNAIATYTNWHSGQPNNYHNQNCVAIWDTQGYQWFDDDCAVKQNYICQKDASQSNQPATTTTQKPWSANCGPFWEDDPNSFSCYLFSTQRLSWSDARAACQAQQGDLVAISSVSEQFYINGRINRLNSNFFWVGANDIKTETGWNWIDGSPFSFINWRSGQPDNRGNSDCVGVSKADGRWSDFVCTARYGYICEKQGKLTPKPTPALTTPANIPSSKVWGCPRNWKGFNNGYCYVLAGIKDLSWQAARTRCGQWSATLVSIHDDAENKFVSSLFPRAYRGTAWIGLNDLLQEGSFVWSDTSAVTYTRWSNHEPNDNMHKEDCVAMRPGGTWNDYPCVTNVVDAIICKRAKSLQNKADNIMLQGCTAGGLGYRAQCYLYVGSPTKTWTDAQADCHRRKGNLAVVNDRQLQAFVSSELVYRPGQGYWIGLRSPGSHNKSYVWNGNYDVDFTAWSESHTGNERGSCVAMATGRPVGLWKNFACNTHLPYICELPRQGFTTPPPTPPSTTSRLPCPRGWGGYSNICVKVFNLALSDRLSWMESRDYCRNLGGDLLSVWNKNMAASLVSRNFNSSSNGFWWIGLNDRDSEMGHVWSDGHGVGYTNWLQGEPNDYNNREDCVLWKFPENGWNDDNCYIAHNYICQVPRGTVITTVAPRPSVQYSELCGMPNSSWVYLTGNCYFMSPEAGPNQRLSWYQARRLCRSMRADLATVAGSDENGFLTTLMSKHSHWTFWIGLNDLDQGTYRWSDGSPLSYISWQINEPNDAFGGESCVESSSDGLWNDRNCQDKNSYICKKPPSGLVSRATLLPPVSGGGCPVGWISLPILEKCYQFGGLTDDTRKNFTDAVATCSALSASLVSVHNFIEQRYLMTLIAKLPHMVWIGLNDIKHRNYFEWIDNTEVTFTHWGPTQPDENLKSNVASDRRDCVAMNPDPRYAGNWNDMACGNRNHFICQKKRDPTFLTSQPDSTGCPSGYFKHQTGDCYMFNPTPATWNDAQAACQKASGGSLVTILDRFQRALVSLVRLTDRTHVQNVSDIWIGLSMNNARFQWVVAGWPVRFTSWGDNDPDGDGTCVSMDAAQKWHDNNCQILLPSVCQIMQGGPPPATTTVNGACPDSSWSAYGEFCYQLSTDTQRSWPEARYACNVLGGYLVSVHSTEEMTFVSNLISAAQGLDPTAAVWIGLSKGLGDGFSWSDGSGVDFDWWDNGEPSDSDNGQHQDCVQVGLTSGRWNDVDCFDANYFMCKILQAKSTTLKMGSQAVTLVPAVTNQPAVTQPANPQTQPPTQTPYPDPITWAPGNPGTNPPQTNPPRTNPPVQHPTYHYQGGTTQPPNRYPTQPPRRTNPTPQPYLGNNNNNNGGGSSGLSGGAVAGIVLGTVAIVAIAAVLIFVFRSRIPIPLFNNPEGKPNRGFSNALYSSSKGQASSSGQESVAFGFDGNESNS